MKLLAAYTFKNKAGFTLVELMMVMGILALLITISLPLAINFYKTRQLDVVENGIVQALRRAQLKSMAMENDSPFGVYISNDSKKYILFKGSSYAARDSAYDEIFDLSANLLVSGLSEIVFSKLKGASSAIGNITLTIDSQTETININETGRIDY